MRRIVSLVAAAALVGVVALPASAHEVEAPGHDGVWVGGGPVPAQGGALLWSPVGLLPPSHAHGLVEACAQTSTNPSAVTILAPPHYTGCVHGQP